MDSDAIVIEQTRKWITDVVVACNFCPFAGRELKGNRIHYRVENSVDTRVCINSFLAECTRLDNDTAIETTLIIFPKAFAIFEQYLDLLSVAETSLLKKGYEGIYQVASFHPLYRFAKSKAGDAANYTNRSIYPMLHLLREESISRAVQHYPDAAKIPARNISFARKKGPDYMRELRDRCMENLDTGQ